MMRLSIAAVCACAFAIPVAAQDAPSPYTGFERRAIKALSDDDLAELARGGGWGLALAAELNGVPGPAHLLELADGIGLNAAQVAAVTAIHAEMKAEAIVAGARLVAAEQALEDAFRRVADAALTPEQLRDLIASAEAARADLRFVHLARHLTTPPLLTAEQIATYNRLRGYGQDPCDVVPEGHNAAMWRRHNNCG